MILADKIIEERKRNGWSQEELAEKLDVSRQSVSKWEGAQSIPDINRIIQMADLFGVSTDYLLKENEVRSEDKYELSESVEKDRKTRKVSMEEASEFIKLMEGQASVLARGVSLCILSPVILIVFGGFAEKGIFGISEKFAGTVGVIILLIMVAMAVYNFISCGNRAKKFEFLEKEEIDTEYGVDGMVKERMDAFEPSFNRALVLGVVLCILSCLPLLAASMITEKAYIITAMVGVLLLIVATAVNLFVRVGVVKGSYDKLLQEGDYTTEKKKNAPLIGRIAGIYWLIAVAIYLSISFLTNKWEASWIIWPVAGVLWPVTIAIVKIIIKEKV